jgi:hypothetical protein
MSHSKSHRGRFGVLERAWRRIHRSNLEGTRIGPTSHPDAPKHKPPHKHIPANLPRPKRHKHPHEMTHAEKLALLLKIVEWELAHRGRLIYSENWSDRKQFFNGKWWRITGIHADCSQFVAGCLNDAGFVGFNDSDYTGTEWTKGKTVKTPRPGDIVIWGAYPGQHTAFYMGEGWTVGFGAPGGPDHVLLADMTAYFTNSGHPGVRFVRPQ